MGIPLVIGNVNSKQVYGIEFFKGETLIGFGIWHKELNSWLFRSKEGIALHPDTMVSVSAELKAYTVQTLRRIAEQEETTMEYALAVGSVKKGKKKS